MHKQILIVVDDHFLRQRYAAILAPTAPLEGSLYQVVMASTLTSAIWYAERRHFDLVMLDAHLRGPLDTFMRLLADRNPNIQVIEIGTPSASAQREMRHQAGRAMVAPDCAASELLAIVRSLLSSLPTRAHNVHVLDDLANT